jgi:PAS domain S-box-containing protein
MLGMAIYPKGDRPYMLGLHQCAYARVWTRQEERLFQEIGGRLADALTSVLILRILRESERRLEDAQRIAHVGYWDRDLDARRITLSDESCRIFGLQPQDRVADLTAWHERWQALIHAEDRPRAAAAAAAALAGGPRYDVEYRVVRPNGDVRIVHSHGDVISDQSGRPLRQFGVMQDITELRRAEEELRASEERFRTLVQFSFDVYWETDAQHRFTRQEFAEGLADAPAPGSEIGKTRWEVPYLEPDEQAWQTHRATLDAHLPFRDFELARPTPDGGKRYVSVSGLPMFDATGRFLGYRGVGRHITDRKRSEQALRQSEAYLTEAQRLSHTGSWAFDVASNKYVYTSEECVRIFELDAQQESRTREAVARLIHPEDWPRVNEAYEKSVREKVDISSEFRIRVPSGTVKHVHAIRHPVLNDAGDVVQLVGTVIDITERKRAEEALRASETRFRTFVDHAADAFFMLDFEQGTIDDVNRCACESLGYTREELIGMTPLAFDVDLDRATLESIAERAAAGETVLFDRHRHRRKDGSLFPVEVQTSLFWHGGRRFLVKVARDISDRVRAEEQREKLRQLEADLAHINRVSLMGELAASIAHEVNQPLSGVVSNAGASLRWLAADPPNLERAREAATRILRDGKRAGDVIARVRALTRRAATPEEKLDLNQTIQEVLVLIGDEAKRNSVIIHTRFADEVFPVLGDRVKLQQVVLNLVMNGIEAMSGVGERARELTIATGNLDPDQVQVTVEDSGTGLDPSAMDKIFDPFYTTKPGGMGMGLSISRSILQAHGGRLWATAKDGPGTVFHFTLPKHREEELHA